MLKGTFINAFRLVRINKIRLISHRPAQNKQGSVPVQNTYILSH